jgi:hypothetical protein
MPAVKAKVLDLQHLINTCPAELCEIVHKRAIAGQNRLNLDKTFRPDETDAKVCSVALTSQ